MWMTILTILLAAEPQVEVRTLDGGSTAGTLVELTSERVNLTTPEGKKSFSPQELLTVTPTAPRAAVLKDKPAILVELIDRSSLAVKEYHVAKGTAQIALAGGGKAEVPTRSLRSVRMLDSSVPSDKLTKQWADIAGAKAASDVIVVRNKGSLDYLEGVLGDIDSEAIQFQIDNGWIPVKRPKVEGLVYYHAASDPLPPSVAEVIDVQGTHLRAENISFKGESVAVTTPAGLRVSWPMDSIARFDFSNGKIQYLSDLEPESTDYTPFISAKSEPSASADFFRPRHDIGFEQNPLKLDGKIYSKGLALRSRTRLEYRLGGQFRQFSALVGIDDNVREGGQVRLEITGDGKKLWQSSFSGAEQAKTVSADVSGVRKLEILVDYGDDLDIGDWLDLCDAKVTK